MGSKMKIYMKTISVYNANRKEAIQRMYTVRSLEFTGKPQNKEGEAEGMKGKWLSYGMAVMLAGVMAFGMLTGCSAGKEGGTAAEPSGTTKESVGTLSDQSQSADVSDGIIYPIDSDVNLSFYIQDNLLQKSAAYVDFNSVPFYQGLSRNTGISVDWQTYAEGADSVAAYNLLLQDEKLPSIIYGGICGSPSVSTELLADGLIYDLTDYLPKYAPDFWEFINRPDRAEDKQTLLTEEGRILYFPFLKESDYNVTYLGPVIRQDWLNSLGLEAPVTLKDWENVLKAFKDNYGAYFSFTLGRFNNAGIAGGAGAFAPLSLKYFVDNGKIKCANTEESWKEFLGTMHRWYEEGLLDPDFTSADDTAVRAKALNGETGIVFTAMSQLTNFIADAEKEGTGAEWVGLSYPRTAAGAPTTYIQSKQQSNFPGAVITTSCSEEELIAAIEFLNYGYSEDGILYWNFGEDGVSYKAGEDGSPQFTELITGDERGIGEALKDYTGMYNGGVGVQMADMVKAKNHKVAADAVYTWIDNTEVEKYRLPSYVRTEDEQSRYNDINTQIGTYVAEMALKFVTGDESLEDFDKFVEQVEAYGLPELLEIEQAAYDRFMSK